jgi:hypothetical protein
MNFMRLPKCLKRSTYHLVHSQQEKYDGDRSNVMTVMLIEQLFRLAISSSTLVSYLLASLLAILACHKLKST